MTSHVLEVSGLSTVFESRAGTDVAVRDVSFYVDRNQVLGLVGESGSGKSMTGYSLLGIVDAPGRVIAGRVMLDGQDLRVLGEAAMRRLRGNRIAMIFQDPMMTLNPVLSIKTQMVETILAHQTMTRSAALEQAVAALDRVGIVPAVQRIHDYPHQFSGGMRQRVAIAIALLNRPDLIICDEPTTALDVTIQAQILSQMQSLCRDSGSALIWITHDLSIVAGLADRVAVMYAGRIVESGSTKEVIEAPRHPYTQGLIESTPAAALARGAGARLTPIAGFAPALTALPQGCAFHPRCARASARCHSEPDETTETSGRSYRCFHPIGLERVEAPA